jgi:hypothetical protein
MAESGQVRKAYFRDALYFLDTAESIEPPADCKAAASGCGAQSEGTNAPDPGCSFPAYRVTGELKRCKMKPLLQPVPQRTLARENRFLARDGSC